eukprot:10194009-Alexandrium_andersonii.AAC.1
MAMAMECTERERELKRASPGESPREAQWRADTRAWRGPARRALERAWMDLANPLERHGDGNGDGNET